MQSEIAKFLYSNSVWLAYLILLLFSHLYPHLFFSYQVRQITGSLVFRWTLVALLLYSLWRYRTAPKSFEAQHAPMLLLVVALTEYFGYRSYSGWMENFSNTSDVFYIKKAGADMYLTHHNNTAQMAPTQVDYSSQLWKLKSTGVGQVQLLPANQPEHCLGNNMRLTPTPVTWNMETIDKAQVDPECLQQDTSAMQSLVPNGECSYMKLHSNGSYMGVNQDDVLNLTQEDDGKSNLFSLIKCNGENCTLSQPGQGGQSVPLNFNQTNTPSMPIQSADNNNNGTPNVKENGNCLEITVENFDNENNHVIKSHPYDKSINDYVFYMPRSNEYQTDSPAGKAYDME